MFETDKSGISRHISNVYLTKELEKSSTVAKIATVQTEGNRQVKRLVTYYNLDLILSVGYRVNSRKATLFRKWATKTLREHIIKGFTINRFRIKHNYDVFLKAVDDVKSLIPSSLSDSAPIVELIKTFAHTWVSLDAYDKSKLPTSGATKRQVEFTASDLVSHIQSLKQELINQNLATDLFAVERNKEAVEGIVGNIFQSFEENDVYLTIEEKAAHLLYFMVKNHPFIDGNKRVGAFSFIWILNKTKLLDATQLNPQALTALTLLVAESAANNKDKMIGLILMVLQQSR